MRFKYVWCYTHTKQTGANLTPRGYANRPAEFFVLDILLRLCYNNRMSNPEQPGLFNIYSSPTSRHDYGGKFDSGDEGHEFPYVQDLPGQDPISVEKGVSVSFDERYFALAAMSRLYARRARSEGLSEASQTPGLREELQQRYPDLDALVANTTAKAGYTQDDEKRILHGLLKADEMVQIGTQPVDAEIAEQETIHQIRQNFGISAGAKKRNASLKKAKDTMLRVRGQK